MLYFLLVSMCLFAAGLIQLSRTQKNYIAKYQMQIENLKNDAVNAHQLFVELSLALETHSDDVQLWGEMQKKAQDTVKAQNKKIAEITAALDRLRVNVAQWQAQICQTK